MNAFKIEVYDMGLGRGPLEKSAVRVVVCKQEQKQWKMRKKICQKKKPQREVVWFYFWTFANVVGAISGRSKLIKAPRISQMMTRSRVSRDQGPPHT